jgi:hypothetical protein
MARPSKYTPARVAMILAALEAGMSRKGAAEYAGLDESTLANWDRRFPGFSGALKQAEAAVELRAASSIQQAFVDGDWRAGLAWLERRRHDDWGRRDRLDLVATVRMLAREHGLSTEEEREAVAEAERVMREAARADR